MSIFGGRVLDPTYTEWLLGGSDTTQHYLGWKAFRLSRWYWPLGLTDNLGYPQLTSVIFTDSVPLAALVFKLLSPLLPANWQYVGWWGMICLVLQGLCAARLLRQYCRRHTVVVCLSTLFVLSPILLKRALFHEALMAQWLLLLSFQFLLDAGWRQINALDLLTVVFLACGAVSIHFYFVLLCGAIVAAGCCLQVWRYKKWQPGLSTLFVYLLLSLLTLWILGGLNTHGHGVGGGQVGYYSFNFNALINPLGTSSLLPDLPVATGGQYEGYAYLGAGWLFLGACVIVKIFKPQNVTTKFKQFVTKYFQEIIIWGLLICCSLVFALSPTVTLGEVTLLTLNVPPTILKLWQLFRATGRVAWIVVYAFMIVISVAMLRLYRGKKLLALVITALVLQVIDLQPWLGKIHYQYTSPVVSQNPLTTDPLWLDLADNHDLRHLIYYQKIDTPTMLWLTDWALDHDMAVSDFYFARGILDESLVANSQQALAQKSISDLFVFPPDRMETCLGYQLYCYSDDHLVLGYAAPLQ